VKFLSRLRCVLPFIGFQLVSLQPKRQKRAATKVRVVMNAAVVSALKPFGFYLFNVDLSTAAQQTQPPSLKNCSHNHGGVECGQERRIFGRIAAAAPDFARSVHKLLERNVPVTMPPIKVAVVVGGVLEEQGIAGCKCRALRRNRISPVRLVYRNVTEVPAVKKALLATEMMRTLRMSGGD
jgi:hypothetical protein